MNNEFDDKDIRKLFNNSKKPIPDKGFSQKVSDKIPNISFSWKPILIYYVICLGVIYVTIKNYDTVFCFVYETFQRFVDIISSHLFAKQFYILLACFIAFIPLLRMHRENA